MSLAVRKQLVASGKLIFKDEHDGTENPTFRADILDPAYTKSDLIALLVAVTAYYPIEITAVNRGHHDDGAGPGLHHAGGAIDGWPLNTPKHADYMDQNAAQFQSFLVKVAGNPYCYDIGLGGAADTTANENACDGKYFADNDEDHVHLGSQIDE